MKKAFTDIHHHLLYGLDDGAKDARMMYAMLRVAAEQRIARIVATPHVTPGVHRLRMEQYERALEDAREYSQRRALGIEILPGAEILYTDQTCPLLQEGKIPTLAGTNRVLVEFSPDVKFERIYGALEQICASGYVPIVAHVERYTCLERSIARANQIKDELNVLYQMNCSTILEPPTFFRKRFARRMLEMEQIDAVATDAHDITSRAAEMRRAWAELKEEYGSEYAHRLTDGSVLLR